MSGDVYSVRLVASGLVGKWIDDDGQADLLGKIGRAAGAIGLKVSENRREG